jgi:hypothetical protein
MEITEKKIERVIITGSLDEYKKAQAYCREHGFRIIQADPYLTDEKHLSTVTSFRIVAEKDQAQQ